MSGVIPLTYNDIKKQDLIISFLLPTTETTFLLSHYYFPIPGMYTAKIFDTSYVFDHQQSTKRIGLNPPKIYYLKHLNEHITTQTTKTPTNYICSQNFVYTYTQTLDNNKLSSKEYILKPPYSIENLTNKIKANISPTTTDKSDVTIHLLEHKFNIVFEILLIAHIYQVDLKTIIQEVLDHYSIQCDLNLISSPISLASITDPNTCNKLFIDKLLSTIQTISKNIKLKTSISFDPNYPLSFNNLPYYRNEQDLSGTYSMIPVKTPQDQNPLYIRFIESLIQILSNFKEQQITLLSQKLIPTFNSYINDATTFNTSLTTLISAITTSTKPPSPPSSKTIIYQKVNMLTGKHELKSYTSHQCIFNIVTDNISQTALKTVTLKQISPDKSECMTLSDFKYLFKVSFEKYNPKAFSTVFGCIYLHPTLQLSIADDIQLKTLFTVDKYILKHKQQLISRTYNNEITDQYANEFFKTASLK